MSGIAETVDILESRISKLFQKLDGLEKTAGDLRRELEAATEHAKKQALEIAELKAGQETLKLANALLGSDENKRDTKLKINALIREIDYCIAQLSD